VPIVSGRVERFTTSAPRGNASARHWREVRLSSWVPRRVWQFVAASTPLSHSSGGDPTTRLASEGGVVLGPCEQFHFYHQPQAMSRTFFGWLRRGARGRCIVGRLAGDGYLARASVLDGGSPPLSGAGVQSARGLAHSKTLPRGSGLGRSRTPPTTSGCTEARRQRGSGGREA